MVFRGIWIILLLLLAVPRTIQAAELGDLLEPFAPPGPEELDRKVQWVERRVGDSVRMLREKQAREKPGASIAEALALKNTSRQTNAVILSTLGRLPVDDAEVNWDAELRRYMSSDVRTNNPLLMSTASEFDLAAAIGFGLIGFDSDYNYFAGSDSVVSWHSSQDRLYDKLVMRDDLSWSDGQPITAHDVEFSFKLIMTKAVPVLGQRTSASQLRYVKAYDDRTIVFFHGKSSPMNDFNIGFSIIPKHIFEKTWEADPTLTTSAEHLQYERNPVVGGNYTITSHNIGQEIVLTRREEYYLLNGRQVRDKPFFRTIRYRIISEPGVALLGLKGGEIDELPLTPEQWRTQTIDEDFYKSCTKVFNPESTIAMFLWNCGNPFFSDKRVRWAMTHALDHDELLRKLRYGLDLPANGIYPTGSAWAPPGRPAVIKRDLEKAQQLLDEAGWKDTDGDGIRDKEIDGRKVAFRFGIMTGNSQDRIDLCTLLRQNLREIGVEVTVRPLDFAVLQQKLLDHTFEASLLSVTSGVDPGTEKNFWGKDESRNFSRYANPEVDRLFAEGDTELDRDKRRAIYQKIHTLIAEDQPATWLYSRSGFYGFRRELRGYTFSPRGPYHFAPGTGSWWKAVAP